MVPRGVSTGDPMTRELQRWLLAASFADAAMSGVLPSQGL